MSFKDYFSQRAPDYASFRPDYPAALFEWLAGQCGSRDLVWDCACGTGQATLGLAAHFERVIGTDASEAQIAHATPHPRVEYRVAGAEASGLDSTSVDLIAVAQALHWLDRPRFFAEASRVARPGALLAVWCYEVLNVTPAVDAVVDRLYRGVLAGYWTADRALVEEGYRSIQLPFSELPAPRFAMESAWSLPHLIGYLGTWSAVHRYRKQVGTDPLALVLGDLRAAWGDPSLERRVRWPLSVRAARVP